MIFNIFAHINFFLIFHEKVILLNLLYLVHHIHFSNLFCLNKNYRFRDDQLNIRFFVVLQYNNHYKLSPKSMCCWQTLPKILIQSNGTSIVGYTNHRNVIYSIIHDMHDYNLYGYEAPLYMTGNYDWLYFDGNWICFQC